MTSSLARFKPWDAIVVPFTYTDQAADKVRPALVVSSPRHIQATDVVYLAMIASAANAAWRGDVAVRDLRGAGLPAPSVVRPAKIMTLGCSHIVKRLGALRKHDQAKLVASLEAFLAS